MSVKFKLISVDNEATAGNIFVGKVYTFTYDGKIFFFGNLYSSTVSSIEHYDGNLTVITKNTVYKFEKVD